jgi:CDP-paratose 2-epimerase
VQQVTVFGGAGFVGSNLTRLLLDQGYKVTVFDSLARRGSERNLKWLQDHNDGRMSFIHGDVRDMDAVRRGVERADEVFHLAAQVAVTTSVEDPRTDFEVNALGTLNVLEGIRLTGRRIPIVFTSTNKVYGGLEDVGTIEGEERYTFRDLPLGVPESRSLDFHSPYGCSKGAADQYVRDYARIYDIPSVVFRMSCIYGPRQFGNEDQGWIAHFMISAATGSPISIYGNGKQVRDVLYIDDLVGAFRMALDNVDKTAGKVYNVGGGPENALAVWTEFGDMLAELRGAPVPVTFGDWRPGDQPCYISDIRKIKAELGWAPAVSKRAGVTKLWNWINANLDLFAKRAPVLSAAG